MLEPFSILEFGQRVAQDCVTFGATSNRDLRQWA